MYSYCCFCPSRKNVLVTTTDVSALFVQVYPNCSDDLLLHLPFRKTLNDVTCHHAESTLCGPEGGVKLVYDYYLYRNVACFDGSAYLEVNGNANIELQSMLTIQNAKCEVYA